MKKLSVITVCYNNLEGLKRTYKSIASQTARKELEWIIIDGDSHDGTKEFLKLHDSEIDYWVSEPDSGIFNAMNKGIKVASGEYCFFLNSGDPFSSEDVVEKCIPYLDGTDLIYGDLIIYDPNKNEYDKWLMTPTITAVFFMNQTLPHQATFIRTDLHKIHQYREDVGMMGDFIFFAEQIIKHGASTNKIPYSAGVFYLDGVSMKDWHEMMHLRETSFKECFSEVLYNDLLELSDLKKLPLLCINQNLLKLRYRLGYIKRFLLRRIP